MNEHQRNALRAAVLIRELLVQAKPEGPNTESTALAWEECRRLARRITMAARRGWHLAARQLREQLAYAVSTCRRSLENLAGQLDPIGHPSTVPSERELHEDILALEEEFDDTEICLKGKTLSVTTDSIILEGVNLGRFEIVLGWQSRTDWDAYKVVALDPNPAASDSETTHPHVQSDDLCEGDGKVVIRRALGEGRLVDFFVLVRQVLQTYNPGSAYVALDEWNAIRCKDCDALVSEDYHYACDRCGSDVCSECSDQCAECGAWCCSECVSICGGCHDRYCGECLNRCDDCGEPSCQHCLQACPHCAKLFCATCMSACEKCHQSFCQECLDYDQCPKCRKANEEEARPAEEAAPAMAGAARAFSRATLQPLRLGEAVVRA